MNEEIVRNYLKDEGFELAEKWYLYTLQPEWDYVIFMIRRDTGRGHRKADERKRSGFFDGCSFFCTL